jgi:hypothetical protein
MLLECTTCDARVDASVVTSYVAHGGDLAPSFLITFARCPACASPFLATQEEDFGEHQWQAPQRLFPPPEVNSAATFPKPIQQAYSEARACYRAGAYTAAAIMCRKALEAICREHGADERTLAASLKVLRERGVVEQRLFEWADALRDAGNEAAHDVSVTVSAEDASDLLDFTLALGEYLFTFRDKFEQFQKRRSARGQDPGPKFRPAGV